MGLTHTDYKSNRARYAIDWATFTVQNSPAADVPVFFAGVNALWTSRRKGKQGVSYGRIFCLGNYLQENADPEFLLKKAEGSFGGEALARWDGEKLWAPHASLQRIEYYTKFLSSSLEHLPAIPDGFDGWYEFN